RASTSTSKRKSTRAKPPRGRTPPSGSGRSARSSSPLRPDLQAELQRDRARRAGSVGERRLAARGREAERLGLSGDRALAVGGAHAAGRGEAAARLAVRDVRE